jgi:thiol-disulfide isomerase/thioredoxin
MNKRLLVLGVLFVLLVLFSMTSREGFADADGTQVIIAKADWCGHCRKAMPEFEKLASASPLSLPDGSQAVVKMVDADKDKAEMASYDVKGFPTILVLKGGKRHEYGGERTYSGVVDFLKSL